MSILFPCASAAITSIRRKNMPRTDEQNQLIKDRRRAKIIRSAIRVFAENGYEKVSVDDITDAANCSHGLFYHYFSNKPAIFNALVNEAVAPDCLPPCRKALEAGSIEGMKVLFAFLSEAWSSGHTRFHSCTIGYFLKDVASLPSELVPFAKESNVTETLKVLIKQGQDERIVIPGEVDDIARGITDVIEGNFRRLLKDGKTAPIVSGDIILAMLLSKERVD